MLRPCPQCISHSIVRTDVVRRGHYYRKSDGQWVQRFYCLNCKKGFSHATFSTCYKQNKRHKNEQVKKLLVACVSQRRIARILKINRKTVVRKFIFLAQQCELKFNQDRSQYNLCEDIQFDDLETFEHTKCKPLSVTLAVDSKSRRILGFKVAQMPAKGLLAALSRKKYGKREDHRPKAREDLFHELRQYVSTDAFIKSDENPHYPATLRRHFPNCIHKAYKGRRGCITGQGELKKTGYDPLFSLNHTCAMLRANINRLVRKTWCTTKDPQRLKDHILIYSHYHNTVLIQ